VRFGCHQDIPDPQSADTFQRSHLNSSLSDYGKHLTLREFQTELLSLRRSVPALSKLSKKRLLALGSKLSFHIESV
jgi:maltooligosyltrehalose trehalohydrolase